MQRRTPTRHRLRFSPSGILSAIAEGGVTVWPGQLCSPITIRVHGATAAAIDPAGKKVAIGTRSGGVTLATIGADGPERCHPGQIEQHGKPVQSIAFLHKGGWIATAGEVCWLWGY